jgi:NAD+ synthase
MTMSLELIDPQAAVDEVVAFTRHTFEVHHKSTAVVAVSGGIDSALSLTLVTQALSADNVIPVLLPHHNQVMDDAYLILEHNQIPKSQWQEMNIFAMVEAASEALNVSDADMVRKGNLKARCRMMAIYDIAKKENALVCGTENKSEHFLGYFTRFGDAASDLEPISHLYKTQVRQLAKFLALPEALSAKPPSAGLWVGQTDEDEMGFSYEHADQVLHQLLDLGAKPDEIKIEGIESSIVARVITQVQAMEFKLQVPYSLSATKG